LTAVTKTTGTLRMSRRDLESKDAKWKVENQKLADGVIEVNKVRPFQCSSCKKSIEEISDPWLPQMIEFFDICQSECDCGGTIEPASLEAKSSSRKIPLLMFFFGEQHFRSVVLDLEPRQLLKSVAPHMVHC